MAVQRHAGPARPGHLDGRQDGLVQLGRGRGGLSAWAGEALEVADHPRAIQRRLANRGDGELRRWGQVVGMQKLGLTDDRRQ